MFKGSKYLWLSYYVYNYFHGCVCSLLVKVVHDRFIRGLNTRSQGVDHKNCEMFDPQKITRYTV